MEQEKSPAMQPFIYDARAKMASRDVAFRDVFHNNIAGYLHAVYGSYHLPRRRRVH